MHYSDLPIDDWHPSDAARARFGSPAYQLVEQPLLIAEAWGSFEIGNVPLSLEGTYWILDAVGDAWTDSTPALRGTVVTSVPGAIGETPFRSPLAELVHYLCYIVTNDRINQPQMRAILGTPMWDRTLTVWRNQIYGLNAESAQLDVDGRLMTGIRASYGDYTATAAEVNGRVVTLVLHDEDAMRVDARIVLLPLPA